MDQGINTIKSSDGLTKIGLEQSHKLRVGAVLVTCVGATIGKTGLINEEGASNQQINAIESYKGVEDRYVYYFCISAYAQQSIRDNASATTLPIINKNKFADILMPLPPFEEQKRIIKAIGKWISIVDYIESEGKDIKTLIELTRSKILSLAIQGKLVKQDPYDEPAIELLRRVNKDFRPCDTSHYGNIPNGWVECKFEDVVDYKQPQNYIVESTDYSDKYDTPVLTAGKSFIIGYTKETKGIFRDVPVIIFDDFTTDSKLVDFPFKVKSSAMKILSVNAAAFIEYIALLMSITRLVGETHKRYWISEYSKIHILLPPVSEQHRIVATVKSYFNRLEEIEHLLN